MWFCISSCGLGSAGSCPLGFWRKSLESKCCCTSCTLLQQYDRREEENHSPTATLPGSVLQHPLLAKPITSPAGKGKMFTGSSSSTTEQDEQGWIWDWQLVQMTSESHKEERRDGFSIVLYYRARNLVAWVAGTELNKISDKIPICFFYILV